MAVHCAIALAAAALTARAWAFDHDAKVQVLAAATLLIPPYLFTYDALLMTLPLAALGRQAGRSWLFALVWMLTLLPAIAYLMTFPNTIPVAAMLALWGLHWRARNDDTGVQPISLTAVGRG